MEKKVGIENGGYKVVVAGVKGEFEGGWKKLE